MRDVRLDGHSHLHGDISSRFLRSVTQAFIENLLTSLLPQKEASKALERAITLAS